MTIYKSHTFCEHCIKTWFENQKSCPECRKTFKIKDLGKDLLAEKIINDLEVFCVNDKYCKWKDKLELLPRHVKVCEFKNQNLTDWLQGFDKFTSKCPDNQSFSLIQNEHLQERINNELPKAPLFARLYSKDSSSKALFGDFISSKPIIEEKDANLTSKDHTFDILEGILNNDEDDFFKNAFQTSEKKKKDEIVLPEMEMQKTIEMEMQKTMLNDTPKGKNEGVLNEGVLSDGVLNEGVLNKKYSEEETKNDENLNPLNIGLKEDKEDEKEIHWDEFEMLKKRKCKEPLLVLKLKQMKS